jgi:hypothetical protein
MSKTFVFNFRHIWYGLQLSQVQCQSNIQGLTMYTAACQCQLFAIASCMLFHKVPSRWLLHTVACKHQHCNSRLNSLPLCESSAQLPWTYRRRHSARCGLLKQSWIHRSKNVSKLSGDATINSIDTCLIQMAWREWRCFAQERCRASSTVWWKFQKHMLGLCPQSS